MKLLHNIFSFILLSLIRLYRLLISPMLGANCRFTPTCSQYGLAAVKKHGPFKGGWLTLKRIVRCHPFSKSHGHDPVP